MCWFARAASALREIVVASSTPSSPAFSSERVFCSVPVASNVARRHASESAPAVGVTPSLLERIVVEHLRDGRVVEEAVFHRHG
jgi:hypothetical protein